MEDNLTYVPLAEKKWLKLLFDYSKEQFTLQPLPSHDHFHHFRVWSYAKSIISHLSEFGIFYNQEEIENLMIAIFFHDMGMTITRAKEHGKESRNLCRQFFLVQPALAPKNLATILEMIERHDDKEYQRSGFQLVKPALNIILNISDDLDAFGTIGVYRYTEIYHFRGIPLNELPSRILPNLESRFQHLVQQLAELPELISKHRKRFESCRNFFEMLDDELDNSSPKDNNYTKIIQLLIEFSDGPNPDIHSLFALSKHANSKADIIKFFMAFEKEWNEFDPKILG